MAARSAIPDFQTANRLYRGATVTFYTVSGGVKTATKATLYSATTGTATLANPQTLDSTGKASQPIYTDVSVIAEIVGPHVASHDTGIILPIADYVDEIVGHRIAAEEAGTMAQMAMQKTVKAEVAAEASEDAAAVSAAAALVSEGNSSSSESAAAASAAAAAAAAASIGFSDIIFLAFADSPYTVAQATSGKLLNVDTSGGNVVINLPTIAGLTLPFVVGVKKDTNDANTVTVNRGGTDTFTDASTSKVLSAITGLTLIPDTDPAPDEWGSAEWAGTPVAAGSGIGVSGSTVSLDISGLTEDTTPDPAADYVAIYDGSGADHNKVKLQTILTEVIQIAASDETTAITAAADKVKFRMPYAFKVTAVRDSLSTAQTSGNVFTVDIHESGTTILSTKLTIDNGEKTSTTAVTAVVISDADLADDAEITIDVDQIGDGTAKGLKVTLIGYRVP